MGRVDSPSGALLQDWDSVRYFLAVAREGSFSRAAKVLGTEQSTVSRRVSGMEEALGQRLFERGPKGLSQSAFALDLLGPAAEVERAMLALGDRAGASLGRVRGRVRLALTEGMAQHVVGPRLLPELLDKHPELCVDLVTSDTAVDLGRHEADIALRFFRTPKGELVGQRVARIERAVLCAARLSKKLLGVAARDLPWIGYAHPSFVAPERAALESAGAPPPRLSCTTVETQIALVRAGIGVAVAPKSLLTVMPDLRVLSVSDMPPIAPLELHVVTRAGIRRVPRIAAVYEALVSGLSALDKAASAGG